jgi:hypothetical protein
MASAIAMLEQEHRALTARMRDARAGHHVDALATATELGSLAEQASRLVNRAATMLPKRGPDAEWVLAALRGEIDADAARFAILVLQHRNQFPATYLEAFVGAAISRAEVGGRMLQLASRWHGAIPVFDAMTRAAERGALSYSQRRFLTYYVRSRVDEDVEEVRRAHRRLQDATFDAPDAPPGARRAGE